MLYNMLYLTIYSIYCMWYTYNFVPFVHVRSYVTIEIIRALYVRYQRKTLKYAFNLIWENYRRAENPFLVVYKYGNK